MESESPQAVQISKEISYDISAMEHPSYQWNRVYPLQTQTITSLASPVELTFEIPAYVWNPAKSYLTFTPSFASATNAKILHLNQPWMNSLTLSTRAGLRLLDLNSNFEMFYNMQSVFTKVEELETSDITRQQVVCNQLKNHEFSQRYTANTGENLVASTVTANSLNYIEQQYVEITSTNPALGTAPAIANSAYSKRIVIPFHKIRDTILAEDKDELFNEILVLRIQLGDANILGSENLIASIAPATGGINSTVAPVALSAISVSDVFLYVAQEMNQSIVNSIASKVNSADGLESLVPVSYIYKTSTPQATSSSVTQRINSYHGRYCKRLIYAPYISPSAVLPVTSVPRLKYDHSNLVGSNSDTTGAKIVEFYDNLNNNRLSQINIKCANGEDYDYMRRFHGKTSANPNGTVISNRNIFGYNYHFVRDFTNLEEDKNMSKSTLALGLDLTNEVRYDMYNVAQANLALDQYIIVVCSKLLRVTASGVQFN